MPFKCGYDRDWSKSEQLSVSEKQSVKSGSASASARYINSVSDLYATDEIDALLDEIRDLEPVSVHTDDLQDFEIDGSVSRLPYEYDMTCDSRTSVHSWDSHALYHNNTMEDPGPRIGGPVSLYCDTSHLKTPIGILRIVFLVASAVSLCCLCYAGTAKYGLFMLPYVGRIRLMLFIILFSCLVTALLLFLDISLLYHAFPVHYHKWVIAVYIMQCAGYCGASTLMVSLVQIYAESFPTIARVTRDQLIASSTKNIPTLHCWKAAFLLFDAWNDPEQDVLKWFLITFQVFGFLAGLAALLMAIFGTHELCRLHTPQREDTDQLTLTERASREMQRMQKESAGSRAVASSAVAVRMLQSQPVMEPPVTTTVWPIDDVQPCSSKHITAPSNNCNNTGAHVHTGPSSYNSGHGHHGHGSMR